MSKILHFKSSKDEVKFSEDNNSKTEIKLVLNTAKEVVDAVLKYS